MYTEKKLPKTQKGLINVLFKEISPITKEYFDDILYLILNYPKKILDKHHYHIIWEDEDLNKMRETYANLIVKFLNKRKK